MVWKRENIQWAAAVWTKMPCWCQRRMVRLVRDDRKTTVTQITTHYNQDIQNTISEHKTPRTLKQMSYSSRRPHRCRSCQLRTGNGGNNSHRLTKIGPYWKNVAWSDESRFLVRHSDGRVRIWRKELESMDVPVKTGYKKKSKKNYYKNCYIYNFVFNILHILKTL